MKKSDPIQISIPIPCSQDWDAMQQVQGGRHCMHCEKTVVDFTRMTDAQVLDYLKNTAAIPCGRFNNEQLERVIKAVEVPKSNWWARVAAGIILSLGLSRNADGQTKGEAGNVVEQPTQTPVKSQKDLIKNDEVRVFGVKGVLRDDKGSPLVNATVTFFRHGDQHILARSMTDFDGRYLLYPVHANVPNVTYDIVFEYIGQKRVYTDIPVGAAVAIVNGKMDKQDQRIKEQVITSKYVPPLIDPACNDHSRVEIIESTIGVMSISNMTKLDITPYHSFPYEIRRVYGDVLPVGR